MHLHSSYTSPYVRKVKIFLIETGLHEQIKGGYVNLANDLVLRPLNPPGCPVPPPQTVPVKWPVVQ